MSTPLKQAVRRHLEGQTLSDAQLRTLEDIQRRHTPLRDQGSEAEEASRWSLT